jgi:hypothetical protein
MSALTRGTKNTISGTVGTSSIVILAQNKANNYLRIINPSQQYFLAVTYDGLTTPVINGAGYTISPLSSDESSMFVPTGSVQLIGSSSACPYTVEWN